MSNQLISDPLRAMLSGTNPKSIDSSYHNSYLRRNRALRITQRRLFTWQPNPNFQNERKRALPYFFWNCFALWFVPKELVLDAKFGDQFYIGYSNYQIHHCDGNWSDCTWLCSPNLVSARFRSSKKHRLIQPHKHTKFVCK